MSCNNNCGLFGGNNDWIWIIIAVVFFICICNDGNGLFGNNDCNRDCC